MITENSTPKTQARAFSLFAFAGNLGIFIGPLVGGGLSKPADQIPGLFGRSTFLKQYPYALPTFVTGAFGVTAALVAFFFINETLPPRKVGDAPSAPPMTTMELLKAPGVAMVLFIYGYVSLLGLAYTAIVPVFWFTPPSLGGFGFSPLLISVFLAISGMSQAIWLLFAFPPLQHRWGTAGVMRLCSVLWPVLYCFAPITNTLLRLDAGGGHPAFLQAPPGDVVDVPALHINSGWGVAFWVITPTVQALGSSVAMAFTGSQLALNEISPSPASFGTLNALALTLSSGIRAVAPGAAASFYAFGARTQILNGYLVWTVMILLAAGLVVLMRWMPANEEGKVVGRGESDEEQRDEHS
ncbi:hypothetical protein LTS18_005794 [Coniosporium uncinatum]|uniref:Uncharacterized protein n=1 Tax=Coniosporium uncinatum TaxID=93489 RepID=A0ACC3DR07_9PEZI|nr:hypothetical protein LTS18_005794 [Coniosporium uncinatum]